MARDRSGAALAAALGRGLLPRRRGAARRLARGRFARGRLAGGLARRRFARRRFARGGAARLALLLPAPGRAPRRARLRDLLPAFAKKFLYLLSVMLPPAL